MGTLPTALLNIWKGGRGQSGQQFASCVFGLVDPRGKRERILVGNVMNKGTHFPSVPNKVTASQQQVGELLRSVRGRGS